MTFHLVRVELARRRLQDYRQLNPKITDLGYRIHAALEALFGGLFRPWFTMKDNLPTIPVVGYGPPSSDLEEKVELTDPEVYNLLVPGTLQSKEFPRLQEGRIVRFALKAQPTIRWGETRDRDAFLVSREESPQLTREQAYNNWLQVRLQGAKIVESRLSAFGMVPRTHNHKAGTHRTRSYIEAHLDGLLEIQEPDQFLACLQRGIGRGKGFGNGMVRLSPP